MTRRVRLLTFDSLPFTTQGNGVSEGFRRTCGQLSETSVCFESHYDQCPAAMDSRTFGSGPDWDTLRDIIHHSNLSVSARFVCDSRHETRKSMFPAWMKEIVQASAVDDLMSGREACRLSDKDFVWLHVSFRDLTGDESAFENVLDATREVFHVQKPDLLFVTALNGLVGSRSDRFVSLVGEDSIRIPLWIHEPGMHGSRVHAVTGSRDVVPTMIDCLVDTKNRRGSDREHGDAVSLLPAVDDCAVRFGRDLRIEADDLRAIRSDNFLFVQRNVQERLESALYAKPDDVWNVHDVATEYTEVVSRLMKQWPE